VKVTNDIAHPFEVLAKGASAGGDTVLLSMASGVKGPFEDDVQVDWVDSGAVPVNRDFALLSRGVTRVLVRLLVLL